VICWVDINSEYLKADALWSFQI